MKSFLRKTLFTCGWCHRVSVILFVWLVASHRYKDLLRILRDSPSINAPHLRATFNPTTESPLDLSREGNRSRVAPVKTRSKFRCPWFFYTTRLPGTREPAMTSACGFPAEKSCRTLSPPKFPLPTVPSSHREPRTINNYPRGLRENRPFEVPVTDNSLAPSNVDGDQFRDFPNPHYCLRNVHAFYRPTFTLLIQLRTHLKQLRFIP